LPTVFAHSNGGFSSEQRVQTRNEALVLIEVMASVAPGAESGGRASA